MRTVAPRHAVRPDSGGVRYTTIYQVLGALIGVGFERDTVKTVLQPNEREWSLGPLHITIGANYVGVIRYGVLIGWKRRSLAVCLLDAQVHATQNGGES